MVDHDPEYDKAISFYTNKKKPICPECQSDAFVVHCVYGKPGSALQKLAWEGKVILKGCMVPNERIVAFCTKCKRDLYG